MVIQVPSFETSALVTDDAVVAARISSLFRRSGRYFSVLDGPRMTRPDADNEAVRRRNALVMTGARRILLSGLPLAAVAAMQPGWRNCTASDEIDEIVTALRGVVKRPPTTISWGRDNLGVGLYLAKLDGKELLTDLATSPDKEFVELGTHLLVMCEKGDDLAEVIAANIAFACGASFAVFPELKVSEREDWLEELYAIGDGNDVTRRLGDLAQRARDHLGKLDFSRFKTVLFVTAGFPWGIAVPENASSHIYRYPDLGRAVIEGLWASQSASRGARTALLIDPHTVEGSEVPSINQALLKNGTLTRVAAGPAATSTRVQFLLDLVPFDVIVMSSHAGDASGERLTYEYPDSEGQIRRLTVDRAIGIGYDRVEDKFRVTQYFRFHALDGVDWRDKAAKAALPVGSAITAWSASGGIADREEFIVTREPISRVIGSMAIQLHDGPWLFTSHGFPSESAPLILNNSCWSWHELSQRTTFAGARGYIGSLVPITDAEAQEVGQSLFGRYHGHDLATALWLSQRHVYGTSARRPYVMVGLPFVSIRPNSIDAVSFLNKAYMDGISHWSERSRASPHPEVRSNAKRFATFLFDDLQAFRKSLKLGRRPAR